MIHPTAIIHPKAVLDASVVVGPYAVIDAHVQLGPRCRVGPHVHLTGHTTIGADNSFHTGCVIGDAPQDLKYDGAPTRLRMGDHNVVREHATVHRSSKPGEETAIGSRNFLMAGCHVGHNATLGDHVIVANGALLAGHTTVEDRVFISGNCLVHQFVRVGTLALMQGGSAISKDLPPFTIARGQNGICGLNVVGLRRAGYSAEHRRALKEAYHLLFRSRKPFQESLNDVARMDAEPVRALVAFIRGGKRGLCSDTGFPLAGAPGESEENDAGMG
ncbi:MAG: acyl-ACP--UDP-N-acetylglucosamine O-acyltransferase [Verrucomicrobia bacterium]|nr:acyl-ACP--UDP-N-acetylglucosamine O-acyltransferase [Verrucomicrobiota bacterium]MBI3868179.1 acyl-ACP--UDP-N-acetylglucosamine O-acyltransferase [Verrucomicrobiota bacterium]